MVLNATVVYPERLSRPVGIPERALLYRGIGAVRVRATHADRDDGEEQRC